MKLRYILITVIMAGLAFVGSGWLLVKMFDAMECLLFEQKISSAADSTKFITPLTDILTDTTLQTAISGTTTGLPSQIHQTKQLFTVNTSKSSMPPIYDSGNFTDISKKYTSVRPSHWDDQQVQGMVRKVNIPENDMRILFLTLNAYTGDYPALFDMLKNYNVKSTVFLSGVWVRRNPEQAKQIGIQTKLFEIENHGNKNIPLSSNGATAYQRRGTQNIMQAITDVADAAIAIQAATGQTPRYVRSFLNYTDNVAIQALNELNIKYIGATIFADGGGLYNSEKIKRTIIDAPHGSILLISVDAQYPNILNGLKAAFDEIKKDKLPVRFEQLSNYEEYFEYVP